MDILRLLPFVSWFFKNDVCWLRDASCTWQESNQRWDQAWCPSIPGLTGLNHIHLYSHIDLNCAPAHTNPCADTSQSSQNSCSSTVGVSRTTLAMMTHTQGENNSSHTLSLLVETREELWRETEMPICCWLRAVDENRESSHIRYINLTICNNFTPVGINVLMHATRHSPRRERNAATVA